MTRPAGITPDEEYALEIQRQGPSELAALDAELRRFRQTTGWAEDLRSRIEADLAQDRAAIAEIERRYPMEKGHAG